MSAPVRVVLADDHVVLRVGLRSFLEEQNAPSIEVVGEIGSGEEAIESVESKAPDLLLLDLSMAGLGGLETTIELRRRGLPVRILILTQYDEPMLLQRLLEAGANGYVLKSARGEDLMTALRAVLEGGTYIDPKLAGRLMTHSTESEAPLDARSACEVLTPRERQVLALIAQGYTNKEIASSLGVAVKTVMSHRFNLMEKLGIHNRSKLVQFAIRAGLLPMN